DSDRLYTNYCQLLPLFCHAAVYTNNWAVKVRGDKESVDRIAEKYGFINMGQVSVEWLQQQVVQKRTKRIDDQSNSTRTEPFSGALWNSLWYLHCRDEPRGCRSHMNIVGAWNKGYSGKGVVVSVLDDGIEQDHPDLRPNYDPLASYDVNGQDQDPSPSYSDSAANFHGTQCAGTVAAAANKSQCTVGVSFQARIGGIRMLDGDVTDMVEAQSLSFRPQYIDIYLAGWGPEDNGASLEGPGPLTRLALQIGTKTGRHGRGSIFVWPSGNGGGAGDHCSCDGYSSSIYTISISSVSRRGIPPKYLEQCSSTLAAAHIGEEELVNSDRRTRSGTSLSSSVAAGIIALTLEANPSLTWRDVQHIIVQTSNARHLIASDWHVNGAGYRVSHLYGFGLLDAESMVKQAEGWKQVPSQHECVEEAAPQIIHPGSVLTSVYQTTGCSSEALQRVVYVEHVVIRVTIAHGRRGDLSITLTSPSGTVSQLLLNRPLDNSTEGFQNWDFMTAHCWGEQAVGEWTLKIKDTPSRRQEATMLKKWSLVIYGTAEQPDHMHRRRARSADFSEDNDLTEGYNGPCDPECSDDGCDGPGPQQCVTCLHFFLKFKNSSRLCVSECPWGSWSDRRRCKRCFSSCASCSGSRSDQCTSCQPGHHLTEGTNTCTASCGENYFLDHDTNVCRKCSENCLKCTSFSICTECKPDSSLQGNRCQRSCVEGLYHESQGDKCKPCHKACATCAGADACSRCAEGFLMEEWRCVSSCSAGFYATEPSPEKADEHRMCRRCDASCLTCVGPSWGNCTSCSSGHSLQKGVCVVTTECTDGEYQDTDGACLTCDATCLKCKGPRSEDCISCASSRALDGGHCMEACARGKFLSGGQCHLCDHTCATCVDAGSANCTSCDTDKFGMERYLHRALCVDACPEAFYHTSEMTCQPCSENCHLCTGPDHCLKCTSSYYVSDGVCVKLECGEGEVEDPDYDDCMACEEGCKKCVLYNPRHCLSCIEGFYNFQDGCYKYCPAKTYSVEEDMTCVPCEDSCVSCDEHECYWCETDFFLLEGECVSACPDGFYGNDDTNDCEECHLNCATCGGFEDDDCLSCNEGKMLENGECVAVREVCPVQTFLNGDECVDCHPTCESCSGEEENQCTKCGKGRFLTLQQTCVSKCPAGSFASQRSGVCEACPRGCLQCLDAQHCTDLIVDAFSELGFHLNRGYPAGQMCHSCAAGCSSCEKNATHCLTCDKPFLLHEHQCVDECPSAHTVQDRKCQQCPTACRECTPLGKCSGCEENHFLQEDLCVPSCAERFFEDAERGECLRCHADCALCNGPSSSDCDACIDPEATLHRGACSAPCPSHQYRDSTTGECKECDESCLTCTGPTMGSCTSCREGERLDDYSHCVPSAYMCSPHQYADQDGECHSCHKYCHRCSGPGKAHCLTCNQGHLLMNGSCVDGCPTGYYAEESKQRCEPCHASCHSCVGKQSQQCLTCKAHLFQEAKECVETCRHRYHYGNAVSRTCEKCDPSCAECSDGGEDGCLSCVPGLVYLRTEGRCLPSCPEGYYHDSAQHTCESCHVSCKTCSGTRGIACQECDSSCLECRGLGPSNCTVCPAQAILEAGGRCLLCCHPEEDEDFCILSTNLPFRKEEEEEARGNLTIFIIASVLLVLGLVVVFFLIKHSRSKGAQSDLPPRGYTKLGSAGGFGSSSKYGGYTSSSSASHSEDEDDDDDDDEDIVYMGQDGTVYRKFRYGQLGEDEDELEYDDESYRFR
uniref:Proprotein convertase subtilisin/kexin type 5a n=1 Tax=Nothobranchius furzeri TaxID=105023 RepID=A0A8C6KVW4_NOTFU